MKLTFLGTGTSHGVPVIGCTCSVCRSDDMRDKRYRCSAYLEDGDSAFLIDVGPEFRVQALRAGISKVSAVFVTHSHADHLNGLDDLRVFSHTRAVDPSFPQKNKETHGSGLRIYADSNCIRDTKNRFDYIFTPVKEGGGKPKINLVDVAPYGKDNPIREGQLEIIPVPLMHGSLRVTGYLFIKKTSGVKKSIAYLTDCSCIPQSSIDLIKSCCGTPDHLVIDALRREPHSTHFNFDQALDCAQVLNPVHTWFIHMTHNMSHGQVERYVSSRLEDYPVLKERVRTGGSAGPAYDTLFIEC